MNTEKTQSTDDRDPVTYGDAGSNPQMDFLPEYRSHKVVRAGRIESIEWSRGLSTCQLLLSKAPDGAGPEIVTVTREWMDKHDPKPGWYLVQYADGYLSASPPCPFEEGYTLIDDGSEPTMSEKKTQIVVLEMETEASHGELRETFLDLRTVTKGFVPMHIKQVEVLTVDATKGVEDDEGGDE